MKITVNCDAKSKIDSFKPGQLVRYKSRMSDSTVYLLLDAVPNSKHTFSFVSLNSIRGAAFRSRHYFHPEEFELFPGSLTLSNDKE